MELSIQNATFFIISQPSWKASFNHLIFHTWNTFLYSCSAQFLNQAFLLVECIIFIQIIGLFSASDSILLRCFKLDSNVKVASSQLYGPRKWRYCFKELCAGGTFAHLHVQKVPFWNHMQRTTQCSAEVTRHSN